jgi:hypothetical protein
MYEEEEELQGFSGKEEKEEVSCHQRRAQFSALLP